MQTSHAKIDVALARLEQQYGKQTRFSGKGPMEQLITTILSQRTNYENERKAYTQLWEKFSSWQGIMEAPEEAIAQAIAPSNYPEIKAPRIKVVLQQIKEERGDFNLDFLADLPLEEAMNWLMRLPGVGYKTATFLLLFTFQKPVLPVDTHVHRVSQRLGIIHARVTADKAHTVLLNLLPQQAPDLLNFHKLFFKHGQRTCTWNYPKCNQCMLTDICDYYRASQKIVNG